MRRSANPTAGYVGGRLNFRRAVRPVDVRDILRSPEVGIPVAFTIGVSNGTIIAVGGNEDRRDGSGILREVALRVGNGRLAICTAASRDPSPLWRGYRDSFRQLGVEHLEWLDIDDRSDSDRLANLEMAAESAAVFFTGGSQARLLSTLAGSALLACIRESFGRGGTVAGSSAGASVLGEIMMTAGANARSPRLHEPPSLARGLSFLSGVIIDQHFTERGRIGRLMGALAQHRDLLAVGIDENTAIVSADGGVTLRVVGDGCVYVLDASELGYSNHGEKREGALSLHSIRTTLLSHGDEYNTERRTARCRAAPSASSPSDR